MATTVSLEMSERADVRAVGVLRKELRRWLAGVACDPDAAEDVVLAMSEAVENAVDHAFAGALDVGSVTVRAVSRPTGVSVAVSDDGRWQPVPNPPVPTRRGRGLSLIDRLVPSHDLVTGASGTTVTLSHPC